MIINNTRVGNDVFKLVWIIYNKTLRRDAKGQGQKCFRVSDHLKLKTIECKVSLYWTNRLNYIISCREPSAECTVVWQAVLAHISGFPFEKINLLVKVFPDKSQQQLDLVIKYDDLTPYIEPMCSGVRRWPPLAHRAVWSCQCDLEVAVCSGAADKWHHITTESPVDCPAE